MISLNCDCDECNKSIDDGDYVYCESCVKMLRDEIDKLNLEIEKLKESK